MLLDVNNPPQESRVMNCEIEQWMGQAPHLGEDDKIEATLGNQQNVSFCQRMATSAYA